ncbi:MULTISPECIES: hypothetical protein [unclassified Streptomyces]|uniref:hypothetical protein n=1 Tax=unclassified Streptomyces TaxID=2593676 RepID=UPI00358DF2DF
MRSVGASSGASQDAGGPSAYSVGRRPGRRPNSRARNQASPCASEDANTRVAPRIGLPSSPEADGAVGDEEEDVRIGLHWKTRTLVARAAGRPFVWVDDEITGTDRSWVAVHHSGPALLHRVEPRQGLRDDDYAVIDAWLRRRAAP